MKAHFTSDSDPLDVLSHYWGYDSFRPVQADIIRSVLDGHDTLGLMPTGGGKSITFQVPAMMLPGLTIVVTPLISLMKDQVDNLRERDIKASCIYSGLTMREVRLAFDRCRLGVSKILYISPERLRSQTFIEQLRSWQVSLIVVDEAHCISQWGYDFRPSYLNISSLRDIVGADVPMLALTASATPIVRDDIVDKLEFRSGHRISALSFARDNLSYVVRETPDKDGKLAEILANTTGSAIVYVRSRRRTRQIADMLVRSGISAEFYHAGLDAEEKSERQDRWKSGRTRVMVATNAFGMGIDKADVRAVVHVDLPPSIEEYYQEAGRAGRDGKPSYAVIVASGMDRAKLKRQLASAFPPRKFILDVYNLLGGFLEVAVGDGYGKVYEFNFDEFVSRFRLETAMVRGALNILTQSRYIDFVENANSRSRVMIICRRDDLYGLELSESADAVLQQLLRMYPGLFTDYVNIDESAIARRCSLSVEDVYQAMLTLARMKVLHYVPRSANPYICYPTSRELPRYVMIPNSVYEERRAVAEHRIESMIQLVFDHSECRQKRILRYFGEDDAVDCGRCDVCRAQRSEKRFADRSEYKGMPAVGSEEYIASTILRYASHSGGTTLAELLHANMIGPREQLIEVLRAMADRRLVRLEPDGRVTRHD